MSFADDVSPVDCLEACQETIQSNLLALTANLPSEDDALKVQAEKYAICEKALLGILDWAKEGLKARKYGSMHVATQLMGQRTHKTLDQFEAPIKLSEDEKDAEVTMTLVQADGETKSVETTLGKMEALADSMRRI